MSPPTGRAPRGRRPPREHLHAACAAARRGAFTDARACALAAVDAATGEDEFEIELGMRLNSLLTELFSTLVVVELVAAERAGG